MLCPVDGAEISDEECLACAAGTPRPASGERCDFEYEHLAAMMDDSGRETAGISATMLSSPCSRQTWLKTREPWYMRPDQNYQAYRGTISHLMLEGYPEPGSITEQRFELRLENGVIVTGKIDKFNPFARRITDFKSKAEEKDAPQKADRSYTLQLNTYKYLLKYGWPQERITHDAKGNELPVPYEVGVPAGIEIDEMILSYWTMGWVKRIPVPVMREETIHKHLLKGAADQDADEIPEIGRFFDPLNPETKFCAIWCPVREHCMTAMWGG